MTNKTFLAFDIGATSGRSIVGIIENGKLELKELTRFPNQMLQLGSHFHWNIYALFEHLKDAIKTAKKESFSISSIGIDTWGVDFALLAKDGSILGLPYAYRDAQTEGMPENLFKIIPRKEVYNLTGIQVMNFNSIYQLFALKKKQSSILEAADSLLFIPDALSYLLTGKQVVEYTIASTSQMLNPRTKAFESSLFQAAGISPSLLKKIVLPGTKIGRLTDDIMAECDVEKIPVIAVAGHDTAAAIASVPAENEHYAYLSSGTWSLMGIEVKEPIINEETYNHNFTNEGGIEGTIRLLKNITGMWLLEQCLKEWKTEGKNYSYPELVSMAENGLAFQSFIDPDHALFVNPPSMTKAIADYCFLTNQIIPFDHGDFVRCIFESLALKYKYVLDKLTHLAPFPIEKLHVIGGGSRNYLLNQWTANAINIPVMAGPYEATAIGNIMVQAKAAGCVQSLTEMRQIIRNSFPCDEFLPQQKAEWESAYAKFLDVKESFTE